MNWIEKNNKLEKTFTFKSFIEAIDFVNKVAKLAEEQNHHPEILINYNKLTFSLQTHDKNNIITEKDHDLAKGIDQIN